MSLLLVAMGAAGGAPLRYLVDRWVQSRRDVLLPVGTLTVNVAGSLLLGLVVGAAAPPAVLLLAGTGFCGALTTFSTFGFETVRLVEDGAYGVAALNVTLSLVLGLGAAGLGLWAGGLAR